MRAMPDRADRVAWIVIGVVLVATLTLAFRPDDVLPERPLTEDAYYAFAVARNLALGRGVTIDGVHATNGFQPLFTLLCVPAYWLTGGGLVASLRVVLLVSWAIFAAAVWAAGDVARRLVAPERAAAARAFASLAYAGGAYLYFQHFDGLETGLELLLGLLVVRAWLKGEGESTPGAARLGALLGLLVLARIDQALLVAGFVLVLALDRATPDGWRRAVTAGAVAVAVSSPWWLYNRLGFGSFVPTSGSAQQAWELSPGRLVAAADAVMMALAPMASLPGSTTAIETLPWKLLRVGLAIALIVALRQAGRSGALAPDPVIARRLRQLGGAVGVAALGFAVYYVGGSYATWHYPRYFAPLALPTCVGIGVVLARAPRGVRLAAIPLLPALLAAALVDLNTAGAWRHSAFYAAQLPLVRDHVPADAVLASWQSGTLGYFRERVINLDGKVNADALRRKDDMPTYLREQGVDWLVDWPSNVRLGLGVDPAADGWEEVASQGPFTVYRRVR
jgi:hypothetical protein